MRTSLTCQGKPAVAICLELSDALSLSSSSIQAAVKHAEMGKHNVSRDFVPIDSTNARIKRSTNNSKSKKCTVVWLDQLPPSLQEKLQRGESLECMSVVL